MRQQSRTDRDRAAARRTYNDGFVDFPGSDVVVAGQRDIEIPGGVIKIVLQGMNRAERPLVVPKIQVRLAAVG